MNEEVRKFEEVTEDHITEVNEQTAESNEAETKYKYGITVLLVPTENGDTLVVKPLEGTEAMQFHNLLGLLESAKFEVYSSILRNNIKAEIDVLADAK